MEQYLSSEKTAAIEWSKGCDNEKGVHEFIVKNSRISTIPFDRIPKDQLSNYPLSLFCECGEKEDRYKIPQEI